MLCHYAFPAKIECGSLKTSMHLYCDVTSLCKFGALKSYLCLVLSRVPLNSVPLTYYHLGHKCSTETCSLFQNVYYVVKSSMSILQNIARNSDVKKHFKECNTSEVSKAGIFDTNITFTLGCMKNVPIIEFRKIELVACLPLTLSFFFKIFNINHYFWATCHIETSYLASDAYSSDDIHLNDIRV